MRLRGPALVALAASLTAAPGALSAAAPSLFGVVGPGFTITLRDASGANVSRLDPGTYELEVRDLSEEHNFRLTGPGVNRATSIGDTGTETWTVTLQDGTYTVLCDPHFTSMRRELTVGTPPATPPPPAVVPTRLLATVGPARTITLRNAKGAVLKRLKPGAYTVVVRDRTKAHNFHLVGPGVNRKTGVATTGTTTWKVTLRAGTLRFFSDRAAKTLKGSIPVR
jgi:hypothetical protein